jgi:selenide,water dikinase
LLVGLEKADDAAVYQLNADQAIVTTTDFFPPVVDDPYDFGAIAAANALSDIYAMGGEVLFAINLVAFPDNLGSDVLREILRGGAEKVAEAGAVVVGGHSVNDKEPKYGMAVTGIIHPDKIKTKGAARPGEKILLTKPLGVGVITTALKREQAVKEDVAAAVASMKQLNKKGANAAQIAGASAVTDVTGFGLLGHAREMAYQANVDLRFQLQDLPWLPGAIAYGKQDQFPGGTGNNMFFFDEYVSFGSSVDDLMQKMLFTPETSGGLLVSLPAENVPDFIAACPGTYLIGDVKDGSGRVIVV